MSSDLLKTIQKKIKDLREKSGNFWQPQTGQNLIRILPWAEDEPFYYEIRQHFIPWGGARGTGIGVPCLEAQGKDCPVCELSERLMDDDDLKTQNAGKQLRMHSRYYYNVVDLKHPDRGVQVFQSYSDRILMDLATAYADPDCGDFTHPIRGRNVVIEKVDKGKQPPEYKITVKMKKSKLEGWLELKKKVKNLKRFTPTVDLKQIKDLVAQFHTRDEATSDDVRAVADSLPCFGHSYRKLPNCPSCPVKVRCKVITRTKAGKLKVRKQLKKKVGAV